MESQYKCSALRIQFDLPSVGEAVEGLAYFVFVVAPPQSRVVKVFRTNLRRQGRFQECKLAFACVAMLATVEHGSR